jgi:hypothetical protein
MNKNKIIAPVALAGILTLSVLAAIPSIKSQGFTGKCELTLSADPNKGSLAVGENLDVKLSGKLTCGGVEMVNYDIGLGGWLSPFLPPLKTDSSGNYHKDIVVSAPGTHTITATMLHTPEKVSASTTIDFNEKP